MIIVNERLLFQKLSQIRWAEMFFLKFFYPDPSGSSGTQMHLIDRAVITHHWGE